MSTSVLRYSGINNDGRGYEVWRCETTAGTSTNLITPALLKSIEMVTITPMDADACTANIGYLSSFVVGDSTVTLQMKTTAICLVKLEGSIA